MKEIALGVDIGGSGIKAAPVDIRTGKQLADRFRIPTPQPATPAAVLTTVHEVIDHFSPKKKWPIGITFPGVVQHGVVKTAANMDDSWIGYSLEGALRDIYGKSRVHLLNDADAAGFGEFRYGAAQGKSGLIFVVTLGTGIGTALISDGRLVPNTELGHILIDGVDAEEYAAESARSRHDLDWETWAAHVDRYLSEIEALLWPDLIIVGGGVSAQHQQFLPLINTRAPIVPAELFNGAGIIGAAAAAHHYHQR